MAYDPANDITLWAAPEATDGTWLEIKSYSKGEPKVCLFKNSNYGVKPVYRFSASDFVYIGSHWDSIKNYFTQNR